MALCILTSSGAMLCYESPVLKELKNGEWRVRTLTADPPTDIKKQVVSLLEQDGVDATKQFAIFHKP